MPASARRDQPAVKKKPNLKIPFQHTRAFPIREHDRLEPVHDLVQLCCRFF